MFALVKKKTQDCMVSLLDVVANLCFIFRPYDVVVKVQKEI